MPKLGMKPVRQQQLIEATLESVARHGLHGTTISVISKTAGVSSGIISHYFGGKQGLIEATVRYLLQALQDELLRQFKSIDSNDPIARLEAIVNANFSQLQISDQGAKTWMAFWAQAMHDERLARLQSVNERRLISNLKYSLRQYIEQKQIPSLCIDDAAQSIAAMIDGLWLRGALSKAPLDAEKSAALCKAHIYNLLQLPSSYIRTSSTESQLSRA